MKVTQRSARFALFLFGIVCVFTPMKRALGVTISRTNITEVKAVTPEKTSSTQHITHDYPIRIIAPSIKLDSPIQGMGLNKKGELDVPSGKTNNVGWYKNGVTPGQAGAAVLDAHVFAAFSKLQYLTPGSDIYILMASGKKLHFTVNAAKKFKLSEIESSDLFQKTSHQVLNLITCAGNLTKDHSTYDHRLVVYTSLKSIEG